MGVITGAYLNLGYFFKKRTEKRGYVGRRERKSEKKRKERESETLRKC